MAIRHTVGAAIGRPPVTVGVNHGLVNSVENKNYPLMQRIAISQIAFCGRAMRAPTFLYSGVPSEKENILLDEHTLIL